MPEVWGLLPKSQVDSELIEAAIARLILAHNNDETAHLGVGQSLQSHKVSEIIDHVVASIVADKIGDSEVTMPKLNIDKYQIWPSFESLDAWVASGAGLSAPLVGSCLVKSGAGADSYRKIKVPAPVVNVKFGSKNPVFEGGVIFQYNADQIAYFGVGIETWHFMGFKIVNSIVYACSVNGVAEYLTEISGVDITANHRYRAVCFSGSRIEFLVDDVIRAVEFDHLPSSDVIDYSLLMYLKTTAAPERAMLASGVRFFQDI